jgi:hypothetical protein
LIGNCHNNLRNIATESTKLNEDFEQILDERTIGMLREAIFKRCLHEKNKVLDRHKKKLSRYTEIRSIKDKQSRKRWVVNTSNRVLNRRGLNFAITPKSIPTKDIIASVEQGINNL